MKEGFKKSDTRIGQLTDELKGLNSVSSEFLLSGEATNMIRPKSYIKA